MGGSSSGKEVLNNHFFLIQLRTEIDIRGSPANRALGSTFKPIIKTKTIQKSNSPTLVLCYFYKSVKKKREGPSYFWKVFDAPPLCRGWRKKLRKKSKFGQKLHEFKGITTIL